MRSSDLVDFGLHFKSVEVVLGTQDLSDFAAGLCYIPGLEVDDGGGPNLSSTPIFHC